MPFGGGVSGGVVVGGVIPPAVNSLPGLVTRNAGEAIPAHRLVFVASDNLVYVADVNDDAILDLVCGVSTNAASPGQQVFIRFTGELKDPSFHWEPGPIYLGPNGLLTQTIPITGNLVFVGTPLGPTALQINAHHVATLA